MGAEWLYADPEHLRDVASELSEWSSKQVAECLRGAAKEIESLRHQLQLRDAVDAAAHGVWLPAPLADSVPYTAPGGKA